MDKVFKACTVNELFAEVASLLLSQKKNEKRKRLIELTIEQ